MVIFFSLLSDSRHSSMTNSKAIGYRYA